MLIVLTCTSITAKYVITSLHWAECTGLITKKQVVGLATTDEVVAERGHDYLAWPLAGAPVPSGRFPRGEEPAGEVPVHRPDPGRCAL